jgi:hypothetical protein
MPSRLTGVRSGPIVPHALQKHAYQAITPTPNNIKTCADKSGAISRARLRGAARSKYTSTTRCPAACLP